MSAGIGHEFPGPRDRSSLTEYNPFTAFKFRKKKARREGPAFNGGTPLGTRLAPDSLHSPRAPLRENQHG